MNIKSIGPQIIVPVEQKNRAETTDGVKFQESTERDANGRRQESEEEAKRNLSDEELQEALKKLKELPGVKTHNLQVRLAEEEGVKVVFLEDPQGKIIRRLSEAQLWAAVQHMDKATGQIFDKAM